VVRNLPPEALAPPNANGILAPGLTQGCENIRLFEGQAVRRDALELFGDQSDTVIGLGGTNTLFVATFDQQRILMRGWASPINPAVATPIGAVQRYDEQSGLWIDVTDIAYHALLYKPWVFTMAPNPAEFPPSVVLFTEPSSPLYTWDGSTNPLSAVVVPDPNAPKGAKALCSFQSRAWAFNITDKDNTAKPSTLAFSAVNNCKDWTSLGSGSFDIEDDPFPGAALLVLGGRLCIFKGNRDGGAVYVGTPTGVSFAPIRIDPINPGTNVGPLLPRAVLALTSTTAFFLGHDAAYLYDGVRALVPFAEGVARDIAARVNRDALELCSAYYNRATREVEICICTGTSTTPNERWVFDTREQRAYGPMTDANDKGLCSSVTWGTQGTLSWDTWGQASGRTWDNIVSGTTGVPYLQWQLISAGKGAEQVLYAAAAGITNKPKVVAVNPAADLDYGLYPIGTTYYTPPITPKDWLVAAEGGQASLHAHTMMTLQEVTLRHRASVSWTPIVEVSTDGTTWVLVSDGTPTTAAGGRLVAKSYYVSNLVPASPWYQTRVRNTSGDRLNLRDVVVEFTPAGSERHE
jgi:hypothetical protein